MKRTFKYAVYYLFFLFCVSGISAQIENQPVEIGNYHKIYSKILDEDRSLIVSLPYGYTESTKRYPVIFQLDGYEQTYFFRLAEASRLLDEGLIPEFIYVAVTNTDRNRDMFPFKTEYHKTSGGADNFVKFLSDEVIPYIDATFRTTSHKTLIGFSSSALFAFYYFLTQPETFDAYLLCSPSISFDTEFFVDKLNNLLNENDSLNNTLAVVYGGAEGKSYYGDQHYFDMHNCVREITNVLKENSPNGLTWSVTSIPGGLHVPHLCVYEGLKIIFQGWQHYTNPEIIPGGGYYDYETDLAISIKSDSEDIYYTLDGTDPTRESKKYDGAIHIKKPEVVKAKIFGDKYGESSTTTADLRKSDYFDNTIVKNNLEKGLLYKYYEDYYFRSQLPDYDNLIPVESGTTDRINIGMKKRYEGFAVEFNGFIKIPENDNYLFSIVSNNESKFYIDEKEIIHKEPDFGLSRETGSVPLKAGMHKIKIHYVGSPFMKKLDLALSIESQRIKRQELPPEWLFHIKSE